MYKVARKFNKYLIRIFIDQSIIFLPFIHCLIVPDDMRFDSIEAKVSNFESSVVVKELEFAMNLALYGLL